MAGRPIQVLVDAAMAPEHSRARCPEAHQQTFRSCHLDVMLRRSPRRVTRQCFVSLVSVTRSILPEALTARSSHDWAKFLLRGKIW